MAAKIQFKTTQTSYGKLFTMRVTDTDTGAEREYDLYASRPATEYLKWIGPTYLAANGTAWRIGRNVAGGLVAWKTMKLSKRFGREGFRMRSVPGGYKGDFVTSWSRTINGRTYSFSRIFWNGGKDGVTLRVYEGQSTKVLHEWAVKGPVSMKKAKSA